MHRTITYSILLLGLLLAGKPVAAMGASPPAIKEKLQALAVEKVKAGCESCKVTVTCKWVAPAVAKTTDRTITGLLFEEPGLPSGYVTAKVTFGNDEISANAAVQFYISIQQKLPVAATTIGRGQPVKESNLVWQWKDISGSKRMPLSSLDAFKDQTATRMIRKGHLFYTGDLAGAASIQPGDGVAMQYGRDGVLIEIECIAREAGAPGQEIRLYSKETRRTYIAKITRENNMIWIRTL